MLGHPFGDSGIHDKVLSGNETRDPAERRGNGPAVTSSSWGAILADSFAEETFTL